MGAAVHLDHHFPLTADEVDKIGVDGHLAHELVAAELAVAQTVPKFRLAGIWDARGARGRGWCARAALRAWSEVPSG